MAENKEPVELDALIVKVDSKAKATKLATDEEPKKVVYKYVYAPNAIDPDASPNMLSWLVVVSFGFFVTGTFAIAIPTSKAYVEKLGGDSNLNGLLVGLLPFCTAIAAYPYAYIIKSWGVKIGFTVSLALCIVGNILYALALPAESLALALLGRCLLGAGLQVTMVGTYVTRSFGMHNRSKAMLMTGGVTSAGFCLGPLLAYLLTLAGDSLQTQGSPAASWVTVETLPGYVSACANIIYFFLMWFLVIEPPMPLEQPHAPVAKEVNVTNEAEARKPDLGPEGTEGWVTGSALCVLLSGLPGLMVAGWEVSAIDICLNEWGWTISNTSLYLAAINGGLMIGTFVIAFGASKFLTDMTGMLSHYIAACLFALLLIAWPVDSVTTDVAIYSIGGVFFQIFLQNGKSFAWALITKLPPLSWKIHSFTWVMVGYFTGRGVGALIAPFMTRNEFSYFCIGCCGFISILVFATKAWLKAKPVPSLNQQQKEGVQEQLRKISRGL